MARGVDARYVERVHRRSPRARRVGAALAAAVLAMSLAAFTQPRDDAGRFTNLDGSLPRGLGTALKWGVWDRITGKRRESPDRAPVPTVAPDLARLRTPPAPGAPARITWLGHATFLVQLDGVSLLTDPALEPKLFGGIERNVPPGVAIADLPRIDAVLVSHAHYDHLDLPTVQKVGAPAIAGLGLERWFRDRRVFATELGWWSSARVGPVKITFVPAQHWSRRGLFDTNRTLWGGFVIEGTRATIYHSGDTAWFAGFDEIGRRFPGIDAALLPIGAYDPAWFMETMHLNPEQALRAFRALGARTFVAMHWGTFKLADEPLDEPPRRLEAERVRLGIPAERVRVLAVGETLDVARAAGAARDVDLAPAAP
ncbi:MAG TPA: MBL fold metallo-hydrolase [Anaeromyxobacter sp.]|nr:MBL fold metallo-hydrolase [Anaeromyxobacter sp.]